MELPESLFCLEFPIILSILSLMICMFYFYFLRLHTHTGKATKGKVQDIGEVNKLMPLPLPSSVG